ncbi:MAG: response regulator transcription factor [Gammaproteobacteria bacterium]|nr:response regulator transcription factor [Gammaproteobacteria bacterium]
MNILIVDDELLARQRLCALLAEIGPPYRLVGEAANGREALALCRKLEVDLVLMDVRMPEMDGIEAAAQLAEARIPPAVIFVTAYEEHALAAFQGSAVDYLLKPIRRQRLEKSLVRAGAPTRAQLQALHRKPAVPAYLSTNYRGGIKRIPVDDVIFLRADQKYVAAVCADGEALLEGSLKALERQFGDKFFRIHRNALVSRSRLIGLEKRPDGRCMARLEDTEEQLEISRRHLPQIRRWLKEGAV